MSGPPIVIGIDIGTAHARVAGSAWINGGVSPVALINRKAGGEGTPPCVLITPNSVMVGEMARALYIEHRYAENVIYDVKWLIGRCFDDPLIQRNLNLWPFNVVKGEESEVLVEVGVGDGRRRFSPVELLAKILIEMKEKAQQHFGGRVTRAVITVPAFFGIHQRRAIRAAAELTEIPRVQLVQESVCAIRAHGLLRPSPTHEQRSGPIVVLVMNVGDRGFAVDLVVLRDGGFAICGSSGHNQLGDRFDEDWLTDYCLQGFLHLHQMDYRGDKSTLMSIRHQTKTVARTFCSAVHPIGTQRVCLYKDRVLIEVPIPVTAYNCMIDQYMRLCVGHLTKVFSLAGLNGSDVDHIVLVGGASRRQRFSTLLEPFARAIVHHRHVAFAPGEAVVYGAVLEAVKRSPRIPPTQTTSGNDSEEVFRPIKRVCVSPVNGQG